MFRFSSERQNHFRDRRYPRRRFLHKSHHFRRERLPWRRWFS